MRKKPLALYAGMIVSGAVAAASNCWADEAPAPHPIVAGGHVAAIKAGTAVRATVAASPTLSQTTAVRMPDGSIGMVCEQKRNPRAAARPLRTPVPEPQQ
ncbi:MAG TPA: hypothetical protein VLB69_03470 [Rudaea sp.]|nr:hypothetical protein [Rudaea sp.]